jgi:hypothetical protein
MRSSIPIHGMDLNTSNEEDIRGERSGIVWRRRFQSAAARKTSYGGFW